MYSKYRRYAHFQNTSLIYKAILVLTFGTLAPYTKFVFDGILLSTKDTHSRVKKPRYERVFIRQVKTNKEYKIQINKKFSIATQNLFIKNPLV